MVSSSILVSTSDNSYYDYSKKNMLIISPLIQYGDNSINIANYSLSRIPPSIPDLF